LRPKNAARPSGKNPYGANAFRREESSAISSRTRSVRPRVAASNTSSSMPLDKIKSATDWRDRNTAVSKAETPFLSFANARDGSLARISCTFAASPLATAFKKSCGVSIIVIISVNFMGTSFLKDSNNCFVIRLLCNLQGRRSGFVDCTDVGSGIQQRLDQTAE